MFGWFDIQIDLEDLIHSQSFEMNRQQIFKDERGRGQVLTLDGWEFFLVMYTMSPFTPYKPIMVISKSFGLLSCVLNMMKNPN